MTMAKDKDYNKLIHTVKWLRLRRDTLTAHPLCQRCETEGRITPATEVHHIRPVEEAITMADKMQRMYDVHNLQALCHDCHVKTHTELGRCGREATRKRNTEQVQQVIKNFLAAVEFGAGGGFFNRGCTPLNLAPSLVFSYVKFWKCGTLD